MLLCIQIEASYPEDTSMDTPSKQVEARAGKYSKSFAPFGHFPEP